MCWNVHVLECVNLIIAWTYKFHFYYMKNKNGNKANLFLTDIDNLMYEIKTKSIYYYFKFDKDLFDFGEC